MAPSLEAYEDRITKLQREMALLDEQLNKKRRNEHPRNDGLELALRFLSNPWDIYIKGNLSTRRTILRLAFTEPLRYSRHRGVRTPEVAFPFKVLRDLARRSSEMVSRTGFEPVTH